MVQAVKVGGEFLVNTDTSNTQAGASITRLANGGFVATWEEYGLTPGDSSGNSVKAQVFGANGTKVGTEFLVNTQSAGSQFDAKVTDLTNGGFVIAWTDQSGTLGDISGSSVKAQVFSATGGKVGPEFLVNTQTAYNQTSSSITGLTNGKFVVTWRDFAGTLGDNLESNIKAQVFNANGTKSGGEFLVNTQTANDQTEPTTTQLANGGFVIAWRDASGTLGDSSDQSIKAQVFGADGTKTGAEFLVNTQTASLQEIPTITGLKNGGFVATWADFSHTLGDPFKSSVKAQVFGEDGAKVGAEFLVNTQTADAQYDPSVTALANGGFVITWDDYSGTLGDSSASSIKAQVFGVYGAKQGAELLVNTNTSGIQIRPAVTGLANGDFVVTWQDNTGPDVPNTQGIKAQIFRVDGALTADFSSIVGTDIKDTLPGTNGDDRILGLAGMDTLNGLGGNDTLDGGTGNDIMNGGLGNDTYIVDSLSDKAVELAGEGTDTVLTAIALYRLGENVENLTFTYAGEGIGKVMGNAQANVLTGAAGADTLLGLDGDDTLLGLGGNDNVNGGAGNDLLNGGTGVDTLIGGFGDDRFIVDNVGDVVREGAGAGTDRVESSVTFTLGAYVEELTLMGSAAIDGTGSRIANVLTGNEAANILSGLGGNDTLLGMGGNDALNGGSGQDTLTGGLGADTFLFASTSTASLGSTVDLVTDFSRLDGDKLAFSKAVFNGLGAVGALTEDGFYAGTSAHDATDRVIYDDATGSLYYDADGNGRRAQVLVATIGEENHAFLSFDDFLIMA
jgi:Ca2+-binding RTX toxin-like protein